MSFSGAIEGVRGAYKGKALMLQKDEVLPVSYVNREVFFEEIEGKLIGCIAYDSVQGEYMIQPERKKTFLLESGQPLGAGRLYYIPRGMGIYIGNGNHAYRLL